MIGNQLCGQVSSVPAPCELSRLGPTPGPASEPRTLGCGLCGGGGGLGPGGVGFASAAAAVAPA